MSLLHRGLDATLLYHVNLGAPLWDQGARLELDSRELVTHDPSTRDAFASWSEPSPVEPGREGRNIEHVVHSHDALAQARVVNRTLGLDFSLAWHVYTLPRFHQWVHAGRGVAVLGLEPANCSLRGRAHDRAAGALPMLAPAERRTTRLRITVGPLP